MLKRLMAVLLSFCLGIAPLFTNIVYAESVETETIVDSTSSESETIADIADEETETVMDSVPSEVETIADNVFSETETTEDTTYAIEEQYISEMESLLQSGAFESNADGESKVWTDEEVSSAKKMLDELLEEYADNMEPAVDGQQEDVLLEADADKLRHYAAAYRSLYQWLSKKGGFYVSGRIAMKIADDYSFIVCLVYGPPSSVSDKFNDYISFGLSSTGVVSNLFLYNCEYKPNSAFDVEGSLIIDPARIDLLETDRVYNFRITRSYLNPLSISQLQESASLMLLSGLVELYNKGIGNVTLKDFGFEGFYPAGTGVHTWDKGKIVKNATSNEDGEKVHTCVICGSTKSVRIPATGPWHRLYGTGRYDTMRAIIREGFKETGGTVLVATGTGFKDALAAAGLAGLYDAPIILTDGKNLSSQAKAELVRLKPSRIYIAGGTFAVSDNVLKQIKTATNKTPVRLFGQNSSETSAKLALAGKGSWSNTAIIATNKSFKDALSVAPLAYANKMPILLADNGKSVSKAVLNALKNCGIKNIIIVGGTAAVSDKAKGQLTGAGFKIKKRLWGNTGVETSAAIAKYGIENLGMSANMMGVATSQNYPDALAGAALCGHNKAVLVLADDKATANTSFPKTYKKSIRKGYVFGGTSAVGDKTMNMLINAVK